MDARPASQPAPSPSSAVTSIGAAARRALAAADALAILGASSRGAFLRAGADGVAFLSREAARGPLTLNLDPYPTPLARLQPGDAAELAGDELRFPTLDLALDLAGAPSWLAPPPGATSPADPRERRRRVIDLARRVLPHVGGGGLSPLLARLLGLPAPDPLAPPLAARWDALRALRNTASTAAWVTGLAGFLGWGPGLTPSGDDLCAGALLALARWPALRPAGLDWDGLRAALIPRARAATTALSAGLIACAADGQADERLLAALDALLTGPPDLDAAAAGLAGWGHSSGADALLGMTLVLLENDYN